MRFSFAAAVGFAAAAQALNILITNDDGFGASNMRAMYYAMKAYGHNCYIVASATDMSGQGGRAVFTTNANLTSDSEFGLVKAGAPSFGQDPFDSHIFYYNGTPATMIFLALDYVLPTFANFTTPDLVLAGPNFGLNLGPFLYTLSGTIGATYAAVERGIPAIAFSGAWGVQTSYTWINSSTAAGLLDPSTIYGKLSANLAQSFITKSAGKRILPLGYGVSVNIPFITSFTNTSCVNPPYILTRQTYGATIDKAVYNATSGLFSYANIVPDGLNQCINGDCSLPGETVILSSGCQSSVSFFTVDYDAPYASECSNITSIYSLVPPIVNLNNATTKVGGLGANATVTAPKNGTASGTASASASASRTASASGTASATLVPTSAAEKLQLPAAAGMMGLMAALLL